MTTLSWLTAKMHEQEKALFCSRPQRFLTAPRTEASFTLTAPSQDTRFTLTSPSQDASFTLTAPTPYCNQTNFSISLPEELFSYFHTDGLYQLFLFDIHYS